MMVLFFFQTGFAVGSIEGRVAIHYADKAKEKVRGRMIVIIAPVYLISFLLFRINFPLNVTVKAIKFIVSIV